MLLSNIHGHKFQWVRENFVSFCTESSFPHEWSGTVPSLHSKYLVPLTHWGCPLARALCCSPRSHEFCVMPIVWIQSVPVYCNGSTKPAIPDSTQTSGRPQCDAEDCERSRTGQADRIRPHERRGGGQGRTHGQFQGRQLLAPQRHRVPRYAVISITETEFQCRQLLAPQRHRVPRYAVISITETEFQCRQLLAPQRHRVPM